MPIIPIKMEKSCFIEICPKTTGIKKKKNSREDLGSRSSVRCKLLTPIPAFTGGSGAVLYLDSYKADLSHQG